MSDLSGDTPIIPAADASTTFKDWFTALLRAVTPKQRSKKHYRAQDTTGITPAELRGHLKKSCNCDHGHCNSCEARFQDMYRP